MLQVADLPKTLLVIASELKPLNDSLVFALRCDIQNLESVIAQVPSRHF